MNRILLETHKKQNIDLLRVRDYFYEKCRKLNFIKNICQIIPVLILFVSYLPMFSRYNVVNDYRDYYAGALAICSFVAVFIIENNINKYLQISNSFREEYDIQVLGIKRNSFLYDEGIIEQYKNYADCYTRDSAKYEYWYEEIFSNHHPNNVICCQMDNIIYTYYVYKKTQIIYTMGMIGIMIIVCGVWINVKDVSFIILSFLAIFGILQSFIDYIQVSKELVEKNKFITNRDKKDKKEEYTMDDARNIQDCIFTNREKSLFIPSIIRHKYLEDGNPYYKDLDSVKYRLMHKNTPTIPSNADEIEVLSIKGNQTTKLSVLQDRLLIMLNDLKTVLEKNDISYTLDGGTLIGAKRESGKFIFWDDDIDIAIKYEDFKKKKDLLIRELSDKYEFQDYENEEFYSPRLSSLRMREKNIKSQLYERDSPLCELYKMKGLFIDIYVYSPILKSITLDKIYRHIFIHPIHKRIKKIEDLWKTDRIKYKNKFLKIKKVYLNRVDWYLKHANNDKYYAYTPNYIENLKKAGPYIKKEDLYGEHRECKFEGDTYTVPTNSAVVLKAFYGENWNKSPFVSLDNIGEYSKKIFSVTKLKHIIYFDDFTQL